VGQQHPLFYEVPWNSYATSEIRWQPHGDTATRRAFWDTWIIGCIPDIDTRAEAHCSELFRGLLFDGERQKLGDTAIILDMDVPCDQGSHETAG